MANYLQFTTSDGDTFWVEVDGPLPQDRNEEDDEFDLDDGERQVSLTGAARRAMATAEKTFDDGLDVVKSNATAFIRKIKEIPHPPDEVEVSFGIKGIGELGGSFGITKLGVDANYAVKLTWKK